MKTTKNFKITNSNDGSSNKPLIGVVPDYDSGSKNSYSIYSHYAIRKNYVDAITKAGGAPILIPYDILSIENYLSLCDGFMIVGGNFDINPEKYGEKTIHKSVILNTNREEFESVLVKKILEIKIPILGICNGMQAINVALGGSLMQDILDEKNNFVDHEQSHFEEFQDKKKPYHTIKINSESTLYKITKTKIASVNSSHHQAIKNVGSALNVSAVADDGIIEAIENPTHPFCVGVQWHPEFETSKIDRKIFAAFIGQCSFK
jgi:putative glutamine amidotransferase